MDPTQIKQIIEAGLPDCHAHVDGDGAHFEASVISSAFEAKAMLARHRLVNSVVKDHIHSGSLHALSIRAFTPEEWQRQ